MSKSSISLDRTLICGSFTEGVMEFPPFSATTTGEKASQTDGFQSIRRIDRYPLRSRDKDAPLRLRVSIGVRSMGRPRIGATVMTAAERQRRHRAKLDGPQGGSPCAARVKKAGGATACSCVQNPLEIG